MARLPVANRSVIIRNSFVELTCRAGLRWVPYPDGTSSSALLALKIGLNEACRRLNVPSNVIYLIGANSLCVHHKNRDFLKSVQSLITNP